MPETRSFVLEFALKVVLPTLVAAAGISLLLLHVFTGIFEETNDLDRAYARRSVKSAIASLREGMESVVQENAKWDDAVDNAYAQDNSGWLQETWGIRAEQLFYDASFVVDAEGKTVFASLRNDPANTAKQTVDGYLGKEILAILQVLPKTGREFSHTAATLKSADGMAVLGTGVIVPFSPDKAMPASRLLRLVLVKILDAGILAKLSKQHSLSDLHFTGMPAGRGVGIDMIDAAGKRLATLAWTDRRPGSILQKRFRDVVSAAQSLFLLVVGVLVYISWRGFKQAHESRASAVAASLRDDLTGLANRRMLLQVISERLVSVRAAGGGLSIVYADLDGFKEVNDAYGHEIGDLLLKSAAAGFAYIAQGKDLVSRLGGDEFAIVISGLDSTEQSRLIAQHMITFLAEPMVFGGRIASVSVSVGIVDLDAEDIAVEEILRRADVAMYAAKAGGRNRVQIYNASLDTRRNESRAIARELRIAIEEGKLGVVYQPVVDARSRRTVGVEALVRWPTDSPRRITPDVFVPVAEEFGLIEDLGNFVLTEACRQAAGWPGIFVAVNVSPIQFMNPGFAETVERTLRATGFDAGRLEIEVTEGFVIDNAERATAIINKLHEMRVSVALDDFGTGYSSIGHLRRFKFDKLKLDRSMVVDILRQPSALRLVQGTIAMADALGLRVTAEGIEDENQVSVLRLAGCSQFQGFLFSTPVDAREIAAFLESRVTAIAV